MAWWDERTRLATGYRKVWASADGPTTIVRIALGIAIIHLIAVVLFAQSGLPGALAVPLAVVFGPAGVWGVAIGAGIGWLATSGIGVAPVFAALGTLAAGLVGRSLWLQLAYPYRRRPGSALLAIVPVALVGTTVGTGAATVGIAIFTGFGFATFLPTVLGDQLLLTAVVSPLILILASRRADTPVSGMRVSIERWTASLLLAGLITCVWLAVALFLDLLRTDVRATPDLRAELVEGMPTGIDLLVQFAAGPWGWTLQLLLAIVAAILVATVIVIANPGPRTIDWRRLIPGRDLDR